MTMGKDDRNDTVAVLNFDILSHTLDFLHLGMRERNPSARVALARCARLSRASSAVALRLLWSSLSSPTPLWLLLAPESDWKWTPCKQMTADKLVKVVLEDELWNEPDRWDRFLHYAQLVREMTIQSSSDNEMDIVTLLAALLKHNDGQTIFSSLRVFSWKASTAIDHEGGAVGLIFGLHSIGLKGVLLCMGYTAPLLEAYIDISTSPHVPLLWVGDELVRFQNLRTIQMNAPVAHHDICTVLARLPLTHLQVSIIPQSASPNRTLSATSLRVLNIRGAPSDLAAMLPPWSLPSLERAEISLFDESSHNRDIYKPELAAAIFAPLPHLALRTLHVSLSGASSPRRTAALPLAQFLRGSFQLHSLEAFTLRAHDWYVKLSADDDAFVELAEAWPALRSLELDFPSWHAEGPVPTPLVLLALTRSCVGLQELILPYLDHTVDLEALPPKDALRAHPLRRLRIADDGTKKSNATREVVVALCGFVGGLFPHLSLSSDFPSRPYRRGKGPWTEVFGGLRREHRRH